MRISYWLSDVCSSDLGGSAGIGLAIVRELLGFGSSVLMVARDPEALERARGELADEFGEDAAADERVFALAADVADDEQRREILDWIEDRGEGLDIQIGRAHV